MPRTRSARNPPNRRKKKNTKRSKKASARLRLALSLPREKIQYNADTRLLTMSSAMQACAVTNPFCPEAVGALWPDNSYTKSLPVTINAAPIQIASDANGSGSTLFMPAFSYQYVQQASIAGSVITYAATGISAQTQPTPVRWRLTSWGIRLNCASSKMLTTGTVRIRLFSPQTGSTLATTDLNSTLADSAIEMPISRLIDEDYYVIPMPLGTNARIFVGPDTTTLSAFVNPGWQVIQVGLAGAIASSTQALTAYAYYHYEIVVADGDALNQYAKSPPKDNPPVRQANADVLSRVGNFMEGAGQKVDSFFKNAAVRFLGNAALSYFPRANAARKMLTNVATVVD